MMTPFPYSAARVGLLLSVSAFLFGPAARAGTLLLTAQSFAVLGASAVTNTGSSTISGDLGVYAGSAISGLPPGIVSEGSIHTTDAVAQQAQIDETNAYRTLAMLPSTVNESGVDLGGKTLLPGVYWFSTSAQLTGALTLDFQGLSNALFVFQIGSTLTTASSSTVTVINGNASDGIFWQVGSSATLGTGTTFAGNLLALTSITLNTSAKIECGRAFAQTGAVTLDGNVISSNCAANDFGSGRSDFGSAGFSPASSLTVPEPGGAWLLGIGLFGVVVKRSAPKEEGDAHAS
jgi:type VI secretion system secreted protein VgrG